MRSNYTNLPSNLEQNTTLREFEGYQNIKPSTDPNVYAAMIGYFTNKGFDRTAAELISETIIYQARTDGYNPMQILDTLKFLSSVELSSIVAEILNYNRYKSSSLGFSSNLETSPEIQRNIMA